jgi:hypothetical protein
VVEYLHLWRKSMGAIVFNDVSFDSWLNKKSEEILLKGEGHGISNEEMLILILKANTTHFHHMDVEFREEFQKIDRRFEKLEGRMERLESTVNSRLEKMELRLEKFEEKIDARFKVFEEKIDARFKASDEKNDARFKASDEKSDARFKSIDYKFEKLEVSMDAKFDKIWSFQKWQAGILLALFCGLYLKLFLG